MRLNNKILLWFVVFVLQVSCKEKNMEEENFKYKMSVNAPDSYPIEVHEGVLSKDNIFISPIMNTGIKKSGWGFESSNAGMGGNIIGNVSNVLVVIKN